MQMSVDFFQRADCTTRLSVKKGFTTRGLPELFVCLDKLMQTNSDKCNDGALAQQSSITMTLAEYYDLIKDDIGAVSCVWKGLEDVPDCITYPDVEQLYEMNVDLAEDYIRFDLSTDVSATTERIVRVSAKKFPCGGTKQKTVFYLKLFEWEPLVLKCSTSCTKQEPQGVWKKKVQISLTECEFRLFNGVTSLMDEFIDMLVHGLPNDSNNNLKYNTLTNRCKSV